MGKVKSTVMLFCLVSSLATLNGCFAHVREVGDQESAHYDERYDYVDLRNLSERMASSILSSAAVKESTGEPVIVIYGISNRTSEHIDTVALTNSIRTILANSGKVKFINRSRRDDIEEEIEAMQGRVSPEEQIKLGSQAGAQYMLTGTLSSIEKEQMRQVRVTRKDLRYYKLTMELTDLQTALIEWTDEQEIIREATRPFIGW